MLPLAIVSRTALPSSTLRLTYGSAIGSVGVIKKRAEALFFITPTQL